MVALVTPFRNGQVDEAALEKLLNWHQEQGTQAVVLAGSTGEGNLLTFSERARILGLARDILPASFPLIVACGQPSTQATLDHMKQAQRHGADAALVVSPFYVKPSQEGLCQHFETLSNSSDLPIILYNHPGRTGVDISVDTVIHLSQQPTIVGIKDSHPDLSRVGAIKRRAAQDFSVLCGDDPVTASYLSSGGDGCISVVANIVPRLHREFLDAWESKEMEDFLFIRDTLLPLNTALSLDGNPSAVKAALSLMGKIEDGLRLPLLPASAKTKQALTSVLSTMGLLDQLEHHPLSKTVNLGLLSA
ncbi:MAG TPA: 4-hydroxy-tetrahydrodipicolinate synthase [Alphaproteobacteria bacterium]|nr:4-hydroxy-tetrahydrodipicolinate synthase [Alphaproteobacteria bacterium]